MSENKYCGNCAHSYAKDMDGYCVCGFDDHFTSCDEVCDNHIMRFDGWIEITPDNVDEVDCIPKDKVVVGWFYNKEFRSCSLSYFWFTLKSIVQQGGFYFYVLPELKIE